MIDCMAEAYGCEQRKARKEHKCCECLGKILPGERYHYHHGIWDGEPGYYKVCTDCEKLRAELDRGCASDDGTPFTGIAEGIQNSNNLELAREMVGVKDRRGANDAAS